MNPPTAEQFYGLGTGYHERHFRVASRARRWIIRERARRLSRWIPSGARVLEFGCGPGWNLAGLEGRERWGHDIAVHLEPELTREGIQFAASLDELPDATFDCVLLHHSLEHVAAPAAVLERLRRLLRGGGRVIVVVPLEWEPRYRRYRPAEPNHHLYSWNAQTLASLVAVSGFEIVEAGCRSTGCDRFAAHWTAQLAPIEPIYRALLAMLRLFTQSQEVFVWASKPGVAPEERT